MRAGIELEGVLPLEITFEDVARKIQSLILEHHRKVSLLGSEHVNTFEIQYRNSRGELKVWTVKDELFTLRTLGQSIEVTSPILKDPEDFKIFNQVTQILAQSGMESAPLTGGLHIHIDFPQPRGAEIASLVGIFSEIENELLHRFSILKTRGNFIYPTYAHLKDLIQSEPLNQRSPDLLQKLIRAQNRFHTLNLNSYNKFGTVEFRLFNSTLHLPAIELMTDFSIKLVEAIRTQNLNLVHYLTRSNEPIQLDQVAQILDMKLAQPEAKKALETILFEARRAIKNHFGTLEKENQLLRGITILLGTAAAIQALSESADQLLQS